MTEEMSKKYIGDGNAEAGLAELIGLAPFDHHIRLDYCYNFKVTPRWQLRNIVIPELMVMYYRGGHGLHTVAQTSFDMTGGSILFVSDGIRFEARPDPEHLPDMVALRFRFFTNATGEPAIRQLEPFWFMFRSRDHLWHAKLFEQVSAVAAHASDSVSKKIVSSLIHTILSQCLLSLHQEAKPGTERIRRVVDYVVKHPLERISTGDLARMADLSPKYFYRLFRSEMGLAPKEFLVQIRCRHAQHLLQETGQTVKETAQMLGYPDQYAFSKQFKKTMGISPSECKN